MGKTNPEELITVPLVKCSICGNPCTRGLHQIRLVPVKKAQQAVIGGQLVSKPAVMKRLDFYMCISCVEDKSKWPGKRP